jgi:nucleoside-diphosphate-sugar epimerase
MRVLILGGTLFIGRRIALKLLARGDDVMVVHRPLPDFSRISPAPARPSEPGPPSFRSSFSMNAAFYRIDSVERHNH